MDVEIAQHAVGDDTVRAILRDKELVFVVGDESLVVMVHPSAEDTHAAAVSLVARLRKVSDAWNQGQEQSAADSLRSVIEGLLERDAIESEPSADVDTSFDFA